MDSYAVSSIIVYLFSARLCYSFFSSAEETQGQIITTHTGSARVMNFLWWFLPPVSQTFQVLMQMQSFSAAQIAFALIYPLLYFILLHQVWLYLRMKRM
ncbi:hypothetical protein [Marinicrinis lubricantis]|uniref:Uncharacterized protein n=1 Tax=Marinicrinis lubricantis TaxID=2086470 RepID=A0ABW1INX5_9BACL